MTILLVICLLAIGIGGIVNYSLYNQMKGLKASISNLLTAKTGTK